MSEESQDKIEGHLSSEDILKYLEEIAPDSTCELCKNDTFALLETLGDPTRLIVPMAAPRNRVIGFFVLSCRKCGNSKFLHKSSVEQVIKDRKESSDGEV